MLAVCFVHAQPKKGSPGGAGPGGRPGQSGQGMGMGRMRSGFNLFLLRNPAVQKDLGLTKDQLKKIDAKSEAMMKGFKPGSTDAQKLVADAQAFVDKTLTPTQKARLKQIELQQSGARAMLRDDVAKPLGITAAQKAKMQKIMEDQRAAMTKMFDPKNRTQGGNDRPDFSKMRQMREQNDAKIMAILTPAQKQKWTSMIGKKIDLGEMRMRGMGGPPGGGPPGGGRPGERRGGG